MQISAGHFWLAGFRKAPHSEIPQSFQRDTLEQTELQNIQLRSLALLLFFRSLSLAGCFYFSLLSYISLSVCLSFPLFLSHLSHFSVSFSVFLCMLCLETLLIVCNFRIVFLIRECSVIRQKTQTNETKHKLSAKKRHLFI